LRLGPYANDEMWPPFLDVQPATAYDDDRPTGKTDNPYDYDMLSRRNSAVVVTVWRYIVQTTMLDLNTPKPVSLTSSIFQKFKFQATAD